MFRMFMKEAVIDIPRRTYAKGVFDNADTDNPKLKQNVLDIIQNQIKQFNDIRPVLKYSLVGSILTKNYRDDADLDVNVLFDVPLPDRDVVRKELAKSLRNINGALVPGTKHPINYYVITDPNVKETNDKMADAVFDIKNNTFIRKAKEFKFDAKRYAADFEKRVREIDVVQGELKRDLIDYKELKELNPDDILNLQELINEKLDEIENGIKQLVDIGNTVLKDRADAFATDMTPEEIKTFGRKNQLPKNVIYKMLEKYHYLTFYKELKDILEDGQVTDAEIQSIQTEEVNKSFAFTFGRFNPPTIGHEKLIRTVASQGSDYKIFISRSQDAVKNPLSPSDKLKWMQIIFKNYASHILVMPTNMVLELATKIYSMGYTSITMVVGSDRVGEFKSILNKYNDEKNRHGYYNFKKINIVSAGDRDPDEEGVTGMSASKLRDYAKRGDLKNFKRGVPGNLSEKQKNELFFDVRKGMGLSISLASNFEPQENKIKTLQEFEAKQVRDLYIREVIFNIGEQVNNTKLDIIGKVIRRGTNYIVLEDTNNNLHKSWIWDCIPVSANKEVAVREYNLDVDYGFKAVSEIKEEPKLIQEKKKKMFGELKKELIKMTDIKKEAYDIGHDYAQHTSKITPGEPGYDPNYKGTSYKPSKPEDNLKQITTQDIEEWASSNETIDKYRERYGDNYKSKIDEVKSKMLSFKDYAKK